MKLLGMVVVTAVLLAGTGHAQAAKVTAAQKAEFHAQCMKIASNETLCTCKADAAEELIDEEFMAIVIAAMKGKTAPKELTSTYDAYIRKSNAICIPGY